MADKQQAPAKERIGEAALDEGRWLLERAERYIAENRPTQDLQREIRTFLGEYPETQTTGGTPRGEINVAPATQPGREDLCERCGRVLRDDDGLMNEDLSASICDDCENALSCGV